VKSPSLKEWIPAAIVLVFLGAGAALVLELGVAAAAGRPADSATTTGLISVLLACVPALVTLYLRDTTKPPDPPEHDDEIERAKWESAEGYRSEVRDFLDRTKRDLIGWRPRWRLSA
jgi:hypothetical protein